MLENKELALEFKWVFKEDYYFYIYRKKDNNFIGDCGIRLTRDKNNYYLGNIEYEIYEKFRGNNYAYQVSKILGEFALSKGVDNLIITANPKNKASIKTIEKLGCRFIEVVKIPLRIRLIQTDEHKVAIYEWDLKERMI